MKRLYFCSTVLLCAASVGYAESKDVDTKARLKDSYQYEADNSGRNQRDRSDDAILPESQSNKEEFINRTAAIRKEVLDDNSLSTTASNVKIITLDNGNVVLRGPVKSDTEKVRIENIAKRLAGNNSVQSHLEISR